MFRKLLIISLVLCTGNIFAQQGSKLHPAAPPTSKDLSPLRKEVSGSETDYKANGAPMPDFILRGADGNLITNKDVQYDANLFLMIFNPTCSHCEEMTDLLIKNLSLFKRSKLLMATLPSNQPYMENFRKTHHIDNYPTITLGIDSTHLIDRLFMYKLIPQINIYDKDRKLIKTFCGEAPIDSLKEYIQ